MSPEEIIGKVIPPGPIRNLTNQGGARGLGTVLGNIIEVIFVFAAIAFVFMVVFSAFQWIISGGDKEKVAQARSRLIYAILGIVILSLAFLFLRVFGDITGFEFFAP